MGDGTGHPDRADDRGRDDHGQRRPPLSSVHERFPGGEWLDPAANAISRGLELLDAARVVLALVAGAVVLLYVGAKIERHLLKSQLAVVDGVSEESDGRRR